MMLPRWYMLIGVGSWFVVDGVTNDKYKFYDFDEANDFLIRKNRDEGN